MSLAAASLAAAVLAVAVLPLASPAALPYAAQEGREDTRDTLLPADSASVSPLEEQITGPGEEEDVDREEARQTTRRRADGWRASLTIRSGAVLQEPSGYTRGMYAGDRVKLFQKLTVRNGDWFAAELLTDKDPGERSAADFASGSLSAGLFSGMVRVVAGDFRMRSGQGLLFGSPRSFGKGAAVIEPAIRDAWGVPDGTSSDEARFFRGGAIQARAGPVSVVVFGSKRAATPLFSAEGELRGVDPSGYHRTAAEIARRGTLSERSAGGGLRVDFGERLSVGGSFLATYLKAATEREPEGGASGCSLRRGSIDLRAAVGGLTLFGEALPSGARTPWIAGALFAGPAGRRLVIVRRFYPPADDLHGTFGFSDAAGGSNEEGTYVGAEAELIPGLSASAFLDLYSRIRPVQGSVQPPSGADRLVCLRLAPAAGFTAEIRLRSREREVGVPDAVAGPLPVPGNTTGQELRVRAEARWVPGAGVRCGLRFDHCAASTGAEARERGAMVTADFAVEPWRAVTVDARTRFFRTDSYASGIPAVDVDIPGTIASTIYSGEGSAWSAGWTWRLSRHVRLSLRYAVLRRDDLRRIGTGTAELPSNIREKAGFQLDISL